MNDRPNDLLNIRPEIKKTIAFDSMTSDERFQNETLRPILKLQNPLFLSVFTNYIEKRKGVFYDLSLEKKITYIENSLIYRFLCRKRASTSLRLKPLAFNKIK
jgi:hypothetical protein